MMGLRLNSCVVKKYLYRSTVVYVCYRLHPFCTSEKNSNQESCATEAGAGASKGGEPVRRESMIESPSAGELDEAFAQHVVAIRSHTACLGRFVHLLVCFLSCWAKVLDAQERSIVKHVLSVMCCCNSRHEKIRIQKWLAALRYVRVFSCIHALSTAFYLVVMAAAGLLRPLPLTRKQ